MNERQLQHEIEQLEAWLGSLAEPTPTTQSVDQAKKAVHAELRALDFEHCDRLEAPEELKSTVKAAVRRELRHGAGYHRPTRWLSRAKPWLATAALVLLSVSTFLYVKPTGGNNLDDESFEWLSPLSPEIAEIDSRLTELELRTYANDFLLFDIEEQSDGILDHMEELGLPAYLMDFDDES